MNKHSIHRVLPLTLLLSFCCTFFIVLNTKGQNLNEICFEVGDFSDEKDLAFFLDDSLCSENSGLSITLVHDSLQSILKLELVEGDRSFMVFSDSLSIYLEKHPDELFPLFIDYNGDLTILKRELKQSGLLEKAFYQPKGERWPLKSTILNQGKQLLLFSSFNSQEFAVNNASSMMEDEKKKMALIDDSPSSLICSDLFCIRQFTDLRLEKNDVTKNWYRINFYRFSTDYLFNRWQRTGKRPNFIFYNDIKRKNTIHFLAKAINDTESISGKVHTKGKILQGVNWENLSHTYSGGYFSFPNHHETGFVLTPVKRGYKFAPSSFDVSSNPNNEIEFAATPLELSDGITGYYPMDGEIIDHVSSQQIQIGNKEMTFVEDMERGTVLKLENREVVTLQSVENYGIVNSSFTIAIHFKYLPQSNNQNYCILGSNEEGFRKGLLAVIQANKLLFGFYTNDCYSTTKLNPEQWYQLVVSYDMPTGTQSIFVDGNRIATSLGHPSFIGSRELLLGHGINQDNYFNGYLDNLIVWNRALSDREVKIVCESGVMYSSTGFWSKQYLILLFVLVLILSVASVFFLYRRSRKSTFKETLKPNVTKVRLGLYGNFSMIDKRGVDHASSFSPKTRELFILLLLWTIDNDQGISTNELNEVMWSGFDREKAANNRGVTFNHLRKILAEIEGIDVVFENRFWRVNLAKEITCDYQIVKDYMSQKGEGIEQIFMIVKRGSFLSGSNKEWMSDIQVSHNFDTVDTLFPYLKRLFKNKEYSIASEVADYILLIDDLNVEALYYQLNCLSKQGNKNKARFLFDRFSDNYQKNSGTPFSYQFKPFLQLKEMELNGNL